MALIVQKYGGASLATVNEIQNVALRIKEDYEKGNSLVVVVSARRGVTDALIKQAKLLNPRVNGEQLDRLISIGEIEMIALMEIALEGVGVPAVSRTGAQAGIITDNSHTDAQIEEVSLGDIGERLGEGKIVVVAGFQGISREGRITTLGRGGSDLSTIALAIALKADTCEFYKDVDGIYSSDPKLISDAVKLENISFDELLEMAACGSQVIQAQAIEMAKKHNMPFEVRSSFTDEPGTRVREGRYVAVI